MENNLNNEFMVIIGAIISFLLLVIGFFLKQNVAVTKTLTESVNSLNKTVVVIENNNKNANLNCGLKHQTIDKRLNNHGKRLDDYGEALAVLKNHCGII